MIKYTKMHFCIKLHNLIRTCACNEYVYLINCVGLTCITYDIVLQLLTLFCLFITDMSIVMCSLSVGASLGNLICYNMLKLDRSDYYHAFQSWGH